MRISYFLFVMFGLIACNKEEPSPQVQKKEADRVVVQHILIGFKNSLPGKEIERSQEESKKLALELLEKARSSKDFDELVTAYSDDMVPGIYHLANTGVALQKDEFARSYFKPGFGNMAFELEPGEIRLLEFNLESSPYGYHIIKRLE